MPAALTPHSVGAIVKAAAARAGLTAADFGGHSIDSTSVTDFAVPTACCSTSTTSEPIAGVPVPDAMVARSSLAGAVLDGKFYYVIADSRVATGAKPSHLITTQVASISTSRSKGIFTCGC